MNIKHSVKRHAAGWALPLALCAASIAVAGSASAQDYSPDILELDGVETLAFPPTEQINLAQGGAIEFWVAADWGEGLEYDPPVVINIGEEGISYLVSVMRDRDGIVFSNADAEAVFLADLSDGRLHHITINVMEDGIVAYVDGQLVGTSEIRPMDLPSSGLFVGGLDAEGAYRFTGAIGQLRIWGEPLFEEDIEDFRMLDVLDAEGDDHPDIANLKALSDFAAKELVLVENVEEIE